MTVKTQDGSRLTQWRSLRVVAAAGVTALLVAACGGDSGCPSAPPFGGEQASGCSDSGNTTPKAADLSITLSAGSLPNDGSSTITATITAVNGNRNALPNIPVTVSVNNNAVATVSGSVTDDVGVVLAQVGIGADSANRSVTVTASSGSLTRTATFQIVGASITATPLPAVIAPGARGQVDFRLVDVNSNPMSGKSIVINGVNAVEVTGTTDSNGNYSYAYTAPTAAGSLDIRATAGGVSYTQTVLVQSGPGTIPPAAIAVQSASIAASPSVVPVNTGSTSNRSQVRALFIGAGNQAVQNVRVRFDLAGDTTRPGDSLTSGTNVVYSDQNGAATTAYVPGSNASATNGVTVRACWSVNDFPAGTCPANVAGVSGSVVTTLTVIAEALSVSISTNAEIEVGPTGLDYVKKYLVQVNDAAGNAKAGVQVSPSIDLLRYFKGAWVVEGDKWVQRVPYDPATLNGQGAGNGSCDNEDLNRNGVLEVYANAAVEDANATGRLEPRKADVNISFVGSSTTNNDGQVVLKITYGQSLASWIQFNILVAASGVAGTEGRTSYQGVLPVLADAVKDADVPPAFRLAPYGILASPVVLTTNPAGQSGQLCTNSN
ncbi:MAG: Ig-like domain-containing protein [Burkholderiaceae bacterium]